MKQNKDFAVILTVILYFFTREVIKTIESIGKLYKIYAIFNRILISLELKNQVCS